MASPGPVIDIYEEADMSPVEWDLLDRLLRDGALAAPHGALGDCVDRTALEDLCRAGLVRPVTAIGPGTTSPPEIYVISDWGELRWRQEQRRRRRRQIAVEPGRVRAA